MDKRLLATFLAAAVLGSGYWYYTVSAICKVPIAYSIGSIDPRFAIDYNEARTAVSGAESLWEDMTGRNLFTFDEQASFAINFIYDERQERANEEDDLRSELTDKQVLNDTVREEYAELKEQYEKIKDTYAARSRDYEARLSAHNAEVEELNRGGGAPPEIYEALSIRQAALAKEQKELNSLAYEINKLVNQMNAIGAEGNALINDYNRVVEEYNTRFHEQAEFTQGDYRGDVINIYQYDSMDELQTVLAHEFGHALGLGHVPGETSIMNALMEDQVWGEGLSPDDLSEFNRVCGTERFTLWSILQT